MPEILDNFFAALVDEIRARKPDYLREPFTVAEIYQNLVPYRTHRDRIGVEMNADYEDALLRLLAGEGDLLVLESDTARGEIESELRSSNPNTLMYRDYAAAMVRLNPALAVDPNDPSPEAVGDEEPRATDPDPGRPVAIEELAPSEPTKTFEFPSPHAAPEATPDPEPEAATEEAPEPKDDATLEDLVGADLPEDSEARPAVAPLDEDRCHHCLGELPGRAVLNFCPACGADLRVPSCPSCGEELEPEWRFCVVCGTKAPE